MADGLTERRTVGHQDVDAFRDQVPLVQQRLASRQVEAPAVEPGSPAETERRGETVRPTSGLDQDPESGPDFIISLF